MDPPNENIRKRKPQEEEEEETDLNSSSGPPAEQQHKRPKIQKESAVDELLLERIARVVEGSAIVFPPLTDEQIDQAERAYELAFEAEEDSIRLPDQLRQFYRACNGCNVTGDPHWCHGFNFFPWLALESAPDSMENSVEQRRSELSDAFPEYEEMSDEEERENETVFPAYWLPFAGNGEYYFYFINANPKSKHYGLIKEVAINDPSEKLLGDLNDLLRFVAMFVELEVTLRKVGQRGGQPFETAFCLYEETLQSDLDRARRELADLEDALKTDKQNQ